jgi:hypothetical protein
MRPHILRSSGFIDYMLLVSKSINATVYSISGMVYAPRSSSRVAHQTHWCTNRLTSVAKDFFFTSTNRLMSCRIFTEGSYCFWVMCEEAPPDHLLLDMSPNIGTLISCWELNKFKSCGNKSFRTSKIMTLLYQQFWNLLISQQDMSGPRLGALSNNM